MLLLFVFFYHMTIALWQAIKKEVERGKSQGVPFLFSRKRLPHFLREDTNRDIKAMITLFRIALTLLHSYENHTRKVFHSHIKTVILARFL